MSADFGALKILIQYALNYICAKFHACRQMCAIFPLLTGLQGSNSTAAEEGYQGGHPAWK